MAKKKNTTPTEYEDQCRIFRAAQSYMSIYPELRYLQGNLNGVRLTMGQAVKAKKAGNRKGVPDLDLPLRRGGWNGLHIELKRKIGGKVSEDQKEWIAFLRKQGRKCFVCCGFDDAWDEIFNYLEGGR